MIRKVLICSAAMAAISTAALSADLPSSRAPVAPPPIPVFSWTGVYLGGQVGYAFGNDTLTNAAGATVSASPKGVIGGAHAGYNYQFPGNGLVLGLEGDINGSGYKGTGNLAGVNLYTTKIPVEGSIRGRAGFAVDRALFYATGGAAFGSIKDSFVTGDTSSTTRVGYTVGGGIQYAITNDWSVRAEYRYTNYGTFTETLPIAATSVLHKDTENKVLAGFSYMFPTILAPVVARY